MILGQNFSETISTRLNIDRCYRRFIFGDSSMEEAGKVRRKRNRSYYVSAFDLSVWCNGFMSTLVR